MPTEVVVVFDIGKTNKKCFLFDKNLREIQKKYIQFEEIVDDEGFPCDSLDKIVQWIRSTLEMHIRSNKYVVSAVNFSTYGASFVHIDENNKVLTPLYNYLKPYPSEILDTFYAKYGDEFEFALQTSSPPLGMLNSGLQLFWLKYCKPEVYSKIKYSLHLPQYLSFAVTGIPVNDYTSTGCHTGLWNFKKMDYHRWVYEEGINKKLAPLTSTNTSFTTVIEGKSISVGVGIHDSSAALIPYLRSRKEPFILVSTGTWSISINPFNSEPLSKSDLSLDCLHFLRTDGTAIKASRLFLGNEYTEQVKKLCKHFSSDIDLCKQVHFDEKIYNNLRLDNTNLFVFQSIQSRANQPAKPSFDCFQSFNEAYHKLMIELVDLQVISIKAIIGITKIQNIYVDGGFADNKIFIELLIRAFPTFKITTTISPLGSSLGAALILREEAISEDFLTSHYSVRKY